MFDVGDIVAGKYRVERELGRGGMGMVVAATHIHLGTTVALKFLSDAMMSEAHVVARSLREARASAQLRSEHICRILDFGTEGEVPYIVMELLEGSDLAKLVRHAPLDVQTASDYVIQACLGLAEAHAAGVIHRDLKPSNLFLTHRPDGSTLVKVFDFGVAKVQQSVDVNLTTTASVVGSPGYMSPEQVRASKNVDARSDVWALGVILYKLVSTRMPFKAESITDLAVAIAMDPTPPIGNVPPVFEAIILKCLEKDPARRYQDVMQLVAALSPFTQYMQYAPRDTVPVDVPPTGPRSIHDSPTTLRGSSGVIEHIPHQRNYRPWIIGGALSVVIGIVVGLTWTSGSNAPAPAHQPVVTTPVETMPVETPQAVVLPPAVVAAPPPVAPPTSPPAIEKPKPVDKPVVDKPAPHVATKPGIDKPAEKPAEKPIEKPAEKPASAKPAEKPAPPKPKDPKDIGASRI